MYYDLSVDGASEDMQKKLLAAVWKKVRSQAIFTTLSLPEMLLTERLWLQADSDGNGNLDRDEMAIVLKQMGRDLDAAGLDKVMGEIDADGDGQIDFEEFEAWFFKHATASDKDHLYVVYYETAEGQVSETTMDRLPQLLAYGVITKDTRVWVDGMEDWRTLGEGALGGQDFSATVSQALEAGSDDQKRTLLKGIWESVCKSGTAEYDVSRTTVCDAC